MLGLLCEIATQRPEFTFVHADVDEPHLNPGGTLPIADWRFPVADGSVDRALALSVFTHLDGPTARHYLRELARVLRPGGRALLTFFVSKKSSVIGNSSSHTGITWRDPGN